MFSHETSVLLQKSLPQIPLMICNRDLTRDIDDLVAMAFPRGKLAVVYDYDTEAALGNNVLRALKGRFEATQIYLRGVVAADMQTVEKIRAESQGCDALVAVGSGTINDLCKYAAHLDGKPYIVFPTAASMNGYLSANASISEDGYKKTLTAQMPKAVFCDLSVIAKAPARLSRSGLGDSLARPTAQFDWLLSHLLLGTSYNEVPFALLAPIENVLFENARGIAMGDLPSIELLMHTLLLSGLGMTIAGGSSPASQSEHMVAHAMHMLEGVTLPHTFHGEEIGMTALAMARMQENLLKASPRFKNNIFPEEQLKKLFGEHVTTEAKGAYKVKSALLPLPPGEGRGEGLSTDSGANGESLTLTLSRREREYRGWDGIATQLEKIMLPAHKIEAILHAAGAPTTPEMLGWMEKDYDVAIKCARFLRDRFTVLDLE